MNQQKSILASALFVGLTGSFLSMLEWELNPIAQLFTAPVSFQGLLNGFLLVFNRLFAVSEQHQLFRYVMFPISSPQSDWSGNIAAALVVVTVLFAALSLALAHTRRKIPLIGTMLLVTGVQIYFGVFPSAVWNIILFAAIGLTLANKHSNNAGVGYRGITTVIITLALVSAAVWVVYPGRNVLLHEFSESIRDRFDARINPFAVAPFGASDVGLLPEPEHRGLDVADVREDDLHEMPVDRYLVEYDEAAQGAEIGFAAPLPSLVPAIILVVSLMIAAVVIRFVPPLLKAAKRRRMFDTDESAAAINNMFACLLEWLGIIGLEQGNVVFSAHTPSLSSLVSEQYSEEYARITVLWQKAVYSNHTPGEAERKHMREFLDRTAGLVWKNSNMATKLKIKLHYFL